MKVLHLLGTGRPGGVESFVLQLARDSHREQIDTAVCIVGADGPMSAQLRSAGARVTLLETPKRASVPVAAKLVDILRRESPDIVHAHSGGRLLRLVSKRSGASVISHLHGLEAKWVPLLTSDGSEIRKLLRTVATGADEIAVSSKWMQRLMQKAEISKPIVRLAYGVDISRFSPAVREREKSAARARFGISENQKVVGFIGRLVPQKGLDHLVELAKRLKDMSDVTILIVGDGPLRADVVSRVSSEGLDNVILGGEQLDVPAALAAFDVTVVTSDWEPFGIVSLESMSMGIPVVAFDVGGIPEAVTNNETGLLVPHGDLDRLTAAVKRVISDKNLASTLGSNGRARVQSSFDSHQSSAAVFAEYRGLMQRTNARRPIA